MGFIIELTFPQKGFFQNKIIRVLRILLQRNYKLISCWAWARLPWSIRFYNCWVRFVFYAWEILKLLNKEEQNFILFPVCCDIIWMTRNLITRQSEREVLFFFEKVKEKFLTLRFQVEKLIIFMLPISYLAIVQVKKNLEGACGTPFPFY